MADQTDEDLLAELGVEIEVEKSRARTPQEERVLAGFEDIQRFVAERDRIPSHSTDGDIFERLYALRLARLQALTEWHDLLKPTDHQGLLSAPPLPPDTNGKLEDDEDILASLGVEAEGTDLTTLRHVRSASEKKAAEEIAQRDPCPDFEKFRPLFETVQSEMDTGVRETIRFKGEMGIKAGRFFVLNGQKVYVADMEEPFRQEYGDWDARLRLVYDNGTQSNLLMRSLQRALTKDDTGRRITDPSAGPLFGTAEEAGDRRTGTIYVLSSLSDDPWIAERRDLFHKVGVTGGTVERRIADAENQPTFLMAGVKVERTYELMNISRSKFETLLHRVLEPARADIEITDRFGKPISPREWFVVPLLVIDEAVEAITAGDITGLRYDPQTARLVRR
ncbi:GIY-YIG nuclease family protein [Jannaschia sp. LMIT008]|uniref:GIY-YIG nuclease family protein n=1 Tax=Jannaschia maritima TaxID=3032585 RepID=UPI002811494D|nr:GIY-YIG nuclease family protein [Jannaschia sp. LMIT008]